MANELVGDLVVVLLFFAVVALVVFLIFREFWTWYWKQSEQVALLKSIARNLQLLEERGRPLPPGVVLPPAPVRPGPSRSEQEAARQAAWARVFDPQPGATG